MRLVETHFTKLFTSEGDRNMEDCIRDISTRVTREMNDDLMGKIKDEEIKDAVFNMGSLKAPGPDGLPEDIGETIVVLIPKVRQLERLNHLRPISCCNFIYKIMTKVLVGRLRKVLDVIISPVQSAFIKGRLIQDNIVVVQEVFHKLNGKGNNGSNDIAIKLDMNKAYDRLEWNFLQRVMEKFGFSREWVKLMMSCVKSTTYRFKINGKLSAKIHPQRGLRQGDPLSPYLFIIAAESFTVLMERALTDNLISEIRLAPTAPVITHLLFADDCIIFAGAQEEEIYQLIQIINKYTEASGQRINTEKFGLIFGSQVSIQRRVNIEEITRMASWEEPGRYLGLPATWGRSKNKALEWIQEKILDKMQGWKEKLLNQAGKEVLIKAVIQAIPVYAMNIIKFLKSFHRKIESAIARFWWTNYGKNRSIHWKSWTKMTRSKLNGGLGFKDFECQNTALLAKQAWRLLKEEDAIWARILKAIYYPNCSLWEAGRGRNASWIWKSILEGRDFLRKKGRWSVGSGEGIDIWEDNWVVGTEKLRRFGETQHKRVSELIREGEGWDLEKIRDIFHGNVLELITRTPISLINKKDHFIWPYRNDGPYSVRSGYQAAKEEKDTRVETMLAKASTSQNLKEIWERIWRLPVLEKVIMFLWKAVYGILPVNAKLHQRRSAPTPMCSICQEQEETIQHMSTIDKIKTVAGNEHDKIRNCIIESDCLPLVQAIKARMPLAEADAIIRDILLMLEEAPDVGATWTPREGNISAHQLAAMAAGNQLQRQRAVSPPVQVRNIIRKEAGFANLQNNHHNQTQDNQVSVSTNLQEGQSDKGLPGRVEAETWNNHASQGDRRLQPTTSQRLMNDSSRDTSSIRKMLRGGNEIKFQSGQNLARHRGCSGETTNAKSASAGITQRHHRELQRGTDSAPAEHRTPTMIEMRKEAGESAQEETLQDQRHA
ncbi:uncharacterized protein LOC107633463 [Arachis ipaensis]|uniref:uncharacterized protein LOC107633463 n=1 Tax=Arachis ipaensis TaxID=130454 RepID=UPI0007AF0FD9|nr:uncharacterized protein LOC107633463 [Arachis ipaensis]